MIPALAERCRLLAQRLSPRERLAAQAAIAVLLAAALLIGAESLLAERARLDRQLPQLADRLARMELDAAELARLRGAPRKPAAADSGVLAASARSHGLAVDIEAGDSHAFRLAGRASLSALLPWLGELHAEYGLRVTDMQFDGAAAGTYTVSLGRGASQDPTPR
ncbi:type II secretion system protein GspM [Thauera linaloolentis]|uniref:General secretion pathway protein M n=1 Tax=Thauera linaloolentis (strain DSM 12138 / JCM 21573 / CCUG 41526 / CIP 105981 / IAM 15112 / NBRC 102519 / 47Lol) TaxID=1123367 RepID=N6YPJ3_THAL4|nr:type II secretion system protein GspM [Thauera linaloolentis]ENO84143.1 hypothetical protein C666_17835 [Thauera linaloolentis 47Lol = DSM 12138]MCM8565863.1 type II secretion system protein M [Thauera linaloolentis]